MTLPVNLKRAAQAEFDQAADWYETRKPGLGLSYIQSVREALTQLAQRPLAHPEVFEAVREFLVAKFPYAIYYRPESKQIIVFAIFHTARDPGEWRNRVD